MRHINLTTSVRPTESHKPSQSRVCHDYVDQTPSNSGLCVTHTGKVQRIINLLALYTGVCCLPKLMKFKYFMNFMKVMNLYYKSTLWLSLQKFIIFNLSKTNFHEFQVIHEILVTSSLFLAVLL